MMIQDQLQSTTAASTAAASTAAASVAASVATDTTTYPSYLLCTSAYIPLLLGIAYIVLGDILPNGMEYLLQKIRTTLKKKNDDDIIKTNNVKNVDFLRTRAILAVTSTTLIIKLSELLQTHHFFFLSTIFDEASSGVNLSIMIIAVFIQWLTLDTKLSSLITAIIVSIGGPLSELPFVATGFWHYIPSAADYYPLANLNLDLDSMMFGGGGGGGVGVVLESWRGLSLSSITGPCYFAVTMDAIALGRWFNYIDNDDVDDDDVDDVDDMVVVVDSDS